MCLRDAPSNVPPYQPATPAVFTIEPVSKGSRRRRIWDLETQTHCPIVGVCMPIPALRRLVDKVLGGNALADDYELHCGAVAECRTRTRLSEALQKALDQRYELAVKSANRLKDSTALAIWWSERSADKDLAGALWATLTHPHCNTVIEQKVLGDIHMLQHQVGAAARADLSRYQALLDENATLARALGEAQQRNTRQAAEHARENDELRAELMRLRAQLVGRETSAARLRETLESLEASIPGLQEREALEASNRRLIARIHSLQREMALAREQIARLQRRAPMPEHAATDGDEAARASRAEHRSNGYSPRTTQRRATMADATDTAGAAEAADAAIAKASADLSALRDRAILCVGGRPASVPIYRRLIEHTGGRFLHHDGGDEESDARLESTLAAADLVICQTGCISHNAYWRVKDHCKRTGKRCIFVETPSRAGFERALRASIDQERAPCPANVENG